MKIDWTKPLNWTGAAFAMVALFVVANRIGEYLGLSKSDWAAWVQAIGSIAAIAATYGAVDRQHKREKMRAAEMSRNMTRNSLAAIAAELAAAKVPINRIRERILWSKIRDRHQSFVPTSMSMIVFESCASSLGSINDAQLRNDLVVVYSLIRGYFPLVNELSKLLDSVDLKKIPKAEQRMIDYYEGHLPRQGFYICRLIEKIEKRITGLHDSSLL